MDPPNVWAAHLAEAAMANGHTVLAPDSGSEHLPSPHDVALLLADLVRAVRLDERVLLLDPLAPPWGCVACAAAYSSAWDIVGEAGGVTRWLAQYEIRALRAPGAAPAQ